MTFKKINAWLHLWLGLASGIVVFILGITGCILVFKVEINKYASPWTRVEIPEGGKMLPPSVLYKAVEKAVPNREIESVWYHGQGMTSRFRIHEMDSTVFVNPYNAEVVAIGQLNDFFHFFEDGHYYLWLPQRIGRQVTGWGTFIFFLLLISGLILWWPKNLKKANVNKSFKIKWSGKFKRVNYDLHNVLGFYSIIVALILAFTGLIMSFAWFNAGVYWLAGGDSTEKKRIEAVSDTPTNLKTNMLEQVNKAFYLGVSKIGEHNTDQIIVNFPESASDALYICVDMYKGTWRDVYLDQYTLKELPASRNRLRNEDLAAWIRRSNYGLHVGEIGGTTTKIIYFIVSLICASLPVTGFYVWLGKRKKSKKKFSSLSEPN